jgi:hypothetical protein
VKVDQLSARRVLVNVATRTVVGSWQRPEELGRCVVVEDEPGPVVELVLDGEEVLRRVGAQVCAFGK